MRIYYLADPKRRVQLNAAGIDDTSAYLLPILNFLGMTGHSITPEQLESVTEQDVLLAVRTQLPPLPCTVISFAASQDPAVAAEKKLYGSLLAENKKLAIFTPICPEETGGEVLAYAELADGTVVPACTRSGKRYDYAFDLPASVWYSGDGFPNEQSKQLFSIGIGRVPELRPLPIPYDTTVAYNDELCWQLRSILLAAGAPALHTLPPLEDGTVPDLALLFSGDDDATSANYNLTAAMNMEALEFPYHINAMPVDDTRFIMDKAVYEELKTHGCETALHTNLTEKPYTAQTQAQQIALFTRIFGEPPKTNVNHCFVQDGTTAERLSWLEACQVYGDNGHYGEVAQDPKDINAFNVAGFAFGSSFPHFTCADAAHENRMIGTISIPINYYEPRLDTDRYNNEAQLLWYLSEGAANGRISQFFLHPHYLNPTYDGIGATFAALKRIKSFVATQNYAVWYTTTNNITDFWHARGNSTWEETAPNCWKLQATCPLTILLPDGTTSVTCDGTPLAVVHRVIAGKAMNLAAILAAGEHTLVFTEI